MRKLAVVALGGNALVREDQTGTIEEQEQNVTDTLENLLFLLEEDYHLVISHGNGPQVGNLLMKNDAGEYVYGLPQMPLDVCVADTQGEIGYMIERMMLNLLRKYNINKDVVTLVSQVEVDKDDPAFQDPQKRVGKTYNKEQADKLNKEKGWIFKEEVKTEGGWRRVVPSPLPNAIMNEDVIETLARQGNVVIATGGGGIPVYTDEENRVRPTEAVIDKDMASSLLAAKIKADEFYILTDVPYVYINYKKPGEKKLDPLDLADAKKYLDQGMFSEGSMAPKMRAAVQFVEKGGEKSVITEARLLKDKTYGTKIIAKYE
ncbi:MAG: carbamate kinase [Bacteroidales bacterium]|nr:carbamate kinase [Bacteroidales bacterium]MBS3776429.1 carbamate kinase [Bacteroidales bacterium]